MSRTRTQEARGKLGLCGISRARSEQLLLLERPRSQALHQTLGHLTEAVDYLMDAVLLVIQAVEEEKKR